MGIITKPNQMKVVLGLSGGMDSATLLGHLLEQGIESHCCIFIYGSKHNSYEVTAAKEIIKYYQNAGFPVFKYIIDLTQVFTYFKSNLLTSGDDIPEGHYESENMKLTVVPERNLIFASIMAGLAESKGAEAVALGVHAGDHAIYPDCREEFIMAMNSAVFLSSDRKVRITTPFANITKKQILSIGLKQDPLVPYHLTRTCYKDQPIACGKCGSCYERLEAFESLGLKDPLKYNEV
jgi:7-cyano-7-deazaguanine synthase